MVLRRYEAQKTREWSSFHTSQVLSKRAQAVVVLVRGSELRVALSVEWRQDARRP